VSIAWSVSEHLHDAIGCKTDFATHYHELTQLADELDAACNYNVLVREVGDQVLFLHRLAPGGADRSYGIEVGRLAGLPAPVLARAKEVLASLEGRGRRDDATRDAATRDDGRRDEGRGAIGPAPRRGGPRAHRIPAQAPPDQLALFAAVPHPAVERLKGVDVNALTPLQALTLLAELSASAKGEGGGAR
jgi:DNA mismatch repair protein MutS